MQPGKGGDAGKGETVMQPKPAEAAPAKAMTPAKIDQPKKACDCCHLDTCACCAKKAEPQTVAPEIKEEKPKKASAGAASNPKIPPGLIRMQKGECRCHRLPLHARR